MRSLFNILYYELGRLVNLFDTYIYTRVNKITLHRAVLYNSNRSIEILLNKGIDINKRDSLGRTPLEFAVARRNRKMVDKLINMGANLDIKDANGDTILLKTTKTADVGNAARLLEFGVNPNIPDVYGNTPIFYANDIRMLTMLVHRGAKINYRGKHGQTPVFHCVANVNEEKLKWLIDIGADLNVKLDNGMSIIDVAIEKGNEKILSVLINSGKFNTDDLKKLERAKYGCVESKSIDIEPFKPMKVRNRELRESFISNPVEVIKQYTFLSNYNKDVGIINEVFDGLKTCDERVKTLLTMGAAMARRGQLKIYIASSADAPNVASLIPARQRSALDEGTEGMNVDDIKSIFLFAPVDSRNSFKRNKFIQTFLHELTHAACKHLTTRDYNELEKVYDRTLVNYRNKLRDNKEVKDKDFKKSNEYIVNRIMRRVFHSEDAYGSKRQKAEELLCDTVASFNYKKRHPQRWENVNQFFNHVIDFIDRRLVPKMERYIVETGQIFKTRPIISVKKMQSRSLG